jgi:hypothetical protein
MASGSRRPDADLGRRSPADPELLAGEPNGASTEGVHDGRPSRRRINSDVVQTSVLVVSIDRLIPALRQAASGGGAVAA